MPTTVNKIKVFVASPGDVQAEREQLSRVVEELNRTIPELAPEKGILLELVKWETHVHPGLGRDAQDVVNRQIGAYDIFVGIMWKRFGTPTAVAESGTEEEFQRAYAEWEKDHKLPVMFYFCQAAPAFPRNQAEIDQLKKVVTFRDELSQKGLVWEYKDAASFADVIRPHLVQVLGKLFFVKPSAAGTAEEANRLMPDRDKAMAQERVANLAREYDQIRQSMPSGNPRTRLMSGINSILRTMAVSIYPLLPDLVHSASAGERLAAVAALQEVPSPGYLIWLAHRVGTEKPFIGYQASVALMMAARFLGRSHLLEVKRAIADAKDILDTLKWQDPGQVRTLGYAEQELAKAT